MKFKRNKRMIKELYYKELKIYLFKKKLMPQNKKNRRLLDNNYRMC